MRRGGYHYAPRKQFNDTGYANNRNESSTPVRWHHYRAGDRQQQQDWTPEQAAPEPPQGCWQYPGQQEEWAEYQKQQWQHHQPPQQQWEHHQPPQQQWQHHEPPQQQWQQPQYQQQPQQQWQQQQQWSQHQWQQQQWTPQRQPAQWPQQGWQQQTPPSDQPQPAQPQPPWTAMAGPENMNMNRHVGHRSQRDPRHQHPVSQLQRDWPTTRHVTPVQLQSPHQPQPPQQTPTQVSQLPQVRAHREGPQQCEPRHREGPQQCDSRHREAPQQCDPRQPRTSSAPPPARHDGRDTLSRPSTSPVRTSAVTRTPSLPPSRPVSAEAVLDAAQLRRLSANAISRYRLSSPPRATPRRTRWDVKPSVSAKTDVVSRAQGVAARSEASAPTKGRAEPSTKSGIEPPTTKRHEELSAASSKGLEEPSVASSKKLPEPSAASSKKLPEPSAASSKKLPEPSAASSKKLPEPSAASSKKLSEPSAASSKKLAEPSAASSKKLAEPSAASSKKLAEPSGASSKKLPERSADSSKRRDEPSASSSSKRHEPQPSKRRGEDISSGKLKKSCSIATGALATTSEPKTPEISGTEHIKANVMLPDVELSHCGRADPKKSKTSSGKPKESSSSRSSRTNSESGVTEKSNLKSHKSSQEVKSHDKGKSSSKGRRRSSEAFIPNSKKTDSQPLSMSNKGSAAADKQFSKENTALNPPKFNANFRIPKTQKLPNPLLSCKASSAPKSIKKPQTWLQQRASPKPAAPGSKVCLAPYPFESNDEQISEAERNVRSEDQNDLMSILQGSTDVDLAAEVQAARSNRQNRKRTIDIVDEPPRKSAKSSKTLKERDLVKTKSTTKNVGKSPSSRSRPRTPKKISRRRTSEDSWTPPGWSKRSKSRCSDFSADDAPSPARSSVASRTRSRSRTRSPSVKKATGFSDPYRSEESEDDDNRSGSSCWNDSSIYDWMTNQDGTVIEDDGIAKAAAAESLKRSLRDIKSKKDIIYAQRENYVTLATVSQTAAPTSPQMPFLLSVDEISPANRQEMPNLLQTPSSGSSVLTGNPASATCASTPPPTPPAAVCEIHLDDSDDEVAVVDPVSSPPTAEYIDLENQPSINVHLPIVELWSRLQPSIRNTIETLEDCLKIASNAINKFVSEVTDAEKIKTRSIREEQFQTLRTDFRKKFSLSYERTTNAYLHLLNFFNNERELLTVLRKRLTVTDDLSDPQTAMEDMQTLFKTVTSSSKLDLTRNCGSNVQIAAKLFNLHRTKRENDLDTKSPEKGDAGSVQGVVPLNPPCLVQAAAGSRASSATLDRERPRTPSKDSGYTSPPRVAAHGEPQTDDVEFEDEYDPQVCVQCQEPARVKCPVCPDAVYCSTDCQMMHWHEEHMKVCPSTQQKND